MLWDCHPHVLHDVSADHDTFDWTAYHVSPHDGEFDHGTEWVCHGISVVLSV